MIRQGRWWWKIYTVNIFSVSSGPHLDLYYYMSVHFLIHHVVYFLFIYFLYIHIIYILYVKIEIKFSLLALPLRWPCYSPSRMAWPKASLRMGLSKKKYEWICLCSVAVKHILLAAWGGEQFPVPPTCSAFILLENMITDHYQLWCASYNLPEQGAKPAVLNYSA